MLTFQQKNFCPCININKVKVAERLEMINKLNSHNFSNVPFKALIFSPNLSDEQVAEAKNKFKNHQKALKQLEKDYNCDILVLNNAEKKPGEERWLEEHCNVYNLLRHGEDYSDMIGQDGDAWWTGDVLGYKDFTPLQMFCKAYNRFLKKFPEQFPKYRDYACTVYASPGTPYGKVYNQFVDRNKMIIQKLNDRISDPNYKYNPEV